MHNYTRPNNHTTSPLNTNTVPRLSPIRRQSVTKSNRLNYSQVTFNQFNDEIGLVLCYHSVIVCDS